MLCVHASPTGTLGTRRGGGMSVYVRELSLELGRRGHRVDLFTRGDRDAGTRPVDLSPNVRLVRLGGGDGEPPRREAELRTVLEAFSRELEAFRHEERLQYDLVHSHYWLSGPVGAWAREHWRARHVLSFHTLGAVKNDRAGATEPDLRIRTERLAARECDRILAFTQRERDDLAAYYGAPSNRIGVAPCGVDVGLFRPADRSEARRQLGIDPEACVVLYVGRLAPFKGVETLLASLSLLRSLPRLRAVIVGGGSPASEDVRRLRNLAGELGVAAAVRFPGSVEQPALPAYYSAADVLVIPSRYESFGLVALEALACGTPVISSPVGAADRVIHPGETGLVAGDASPEALAGRIAERFTGGWALPAEAIRASVLEYAWERVAPAVEREYSLAVRGDADSEGAGT